MDLMQCVLSILVMVGGAFVQRVSGFGLGIFAMLFLPYLMTSHAEAAALAGMVTIVGTVYNAVRQRSHIQWKTMAPLAISALLVIPLAVHLSASLPQKLLKAILGVVLIVLSVYFLFFSQKVRIKPNLPNGIVAGGLGGMLDGLFSTGGPPVVIYLLFATADNLAYFATIQAYFAITNCFSCLNRIISGIITWPLVLLAGVSLIGWYVGDRIGAKVFDKLDGVKLKKVIYIGMIISGVLMIVH